MKYVNIILTALVLSAFFVNGSVTVNAQEYFRPGNGQIDLHNEVIVWRYKIADGKLYRRQYNESTGNWVGDWELVSK